MADELSARTGHSNGGTDGKLATATARRTGHPPSAAAAPGTQAVWRNATNNDWLIDVIGVLGPGPDGRIYYQVAGTNTGIPADEIFNADGTPFVFQATTGQATGQTGGDSGADSPVRSAGAVYQAGHRPRPPAQRRHPPCPSPAPPAARAAAAGTPAGAQPAGMAAALTQQPAAPATPASAAAAPALPLAGAPAAAGPRQAEPQQPVQQPARRPQAWPLHSRRPQRQPHRPPQAAEAAEFPPFPQLRHRHRRRHHRAAPHRPVAHRPAPPVRPHAPLPQPRHPRQPQRPPASAPPLRAQPGLRPAQMHSRRPSATTRRRDSAPASPSSPAKEPTRTVIHSSAS